MNSALLIGVVMLTALACPVHMFWAHRRGRRALCCPPAPSSRASDQLQALHERQQQLAERIAVAQEQRGQPAEPPGNARRA